MRTSVDGRPAFFQARCLARRQRPGGNASGDAVLLILAALIHFIISVMLSSALVCVVIDLVAQLGLSLGDPDWSGGRRSTAVGAHFLVDRRCLLFKMGGFGGCPLPGLRTLSNAVLLILLPFSNPARLRKCTGRRDVSRNSRQNDAFDGLFPPCLSIPGCGSHATLSTTA